MKTTLIAAAAIAATLSSCSGAKTSTLTGASFRHTASDKTAVAAADSSQTVIEITLEDPVLDWRFPEADSSELSENSEPSPPPSARLTASRLAVRLSSSDFRRLTLAHAAADTTAADTLAAPCRCHRRSGHLHRPPHLPCRRRRPPWLLLPARSPPPSANPLNPTKL